MSVLICAQAKRDKGPVQASNKLSVWSSQGPPWIQTARGFAAKKKKNPSRVVVSPPEKGGTNFWMGFEDLKSPAAMGFLRHGPEKVSPVEAIELGMFIDNILPVVGWTALTVALTELV